jgi:hypothetical protein
MPIVGVGTREDRRRPKYADAILTPNNTVWAMMDFGNLPTCLVGASTDGTTHAALIANADVYVFPDGFETSGATVGNQANTLQSTLEAFSIPAHWVASQDTYLSVAHTVGAMFQFMQRINGIMGNVDPFAGATLNTQFRNLAQATQDAVNEAGPSMGFNMSGVNQNMTLRNLVKYMADQWGARPLFLGPFTF